MPCSRLLCSDKCIEPALVPGSTGLLMALGLPKRKVTWSLYQLVRAGNTDLCGDSSPGTRRDGGDGRWFQVAPVALLPLLPPAFHTMFSSRSFTTLFLKEGAAVRR